MIEKGTLLSKENIMRRQILPLALSVLLLLAGCSSGGGSSPSRGPAISFPIESIEPLVDENGLISKEDIMITPVREKINIAYTELAVEITNNSIYPFIWYNEYNIYEEVNGEYVLVDKDGDGITEVRGNSYEQIDSGKTVQQSIYLGKITDDDFYSRLGKYKLEVSVNPECVISLEFEVVNDYIPPDTGISIQAGKEQYSTKDKEPFSYTITNKRQDHLSVTLGVHIARYKDGKWERLPDSRKYKEMYYWANMYSVSLNAGSTREQKFDLPLSCMVGKRLSPGKYRLEKKMLWEWYFYEFEVVKG